MTSGAVLGINYTHVARSPTGILIICVPFYPRYPEIRNPHIAVGIQDQIFRLEIPMYDLSLLQVL